MAIKRRNFLKGLLSLPAVGLGVRVAASEAPTTITVQSIPQIDGYDEFVRVQISTIARGMGTSFSALAEDYSRSMGENARNTIEELAMAVLTD